MTEHLKCHQPGNLRGRDAVAAAAAAAVVKGGPVMKCHHDEHNRYVGREQDQLPKLDGVCTHYGTYDITRYDTVQRTTTQQNNIL